MHPALYSLAAAAQNTFIWSEHIGKVITTALLSMVPAFEGRYAISVGLAIGMPVVFTYLLAFVFSTLPMPFIMWLLRPILKWLYSLPIRPLQRFAAWVENRSMRKSKEVDTKGLLGLFLFVAIPLPGTGVWTGTAIATLLEMNRKQAGIVIVLGNMVACLIMTLLTTGVLSFF